MSSTWQMFKIPCVSNCW